MPTISSTADIYQHRFEVIPGLVPTQILPGEVVIHLVDRRVWFGAIDGTPIDLFGAVTPIDLFEKSYDRWLLTLPVQPDGLALGKYWNNGGVAQKIV